MVSYDKFVGVEDSNVFIDDYQVMVQDAQKIKNAQTKANKSSEDSVIARNYTMIARKILETGYKLGFDILTCHIGLKLLSIYLRSEKKCIDKELTTLCIMLLAAKFNQTDETLITIAELLEESTVGYSKAQIVENEREILHTLEWNLNILTPLHFIQAYEVIGVVFESDRYCVGSEIQFDPDSTKVNKVAQKAIDV